MTKHTSKSWRIEYRVPKIHRECSLMIKSENREIADMCGFDGRTMDEARFIIRACNSFDELLAACKGMLKWAHRVKESNPGMEVFNALQAIAEAEKEN